MPSRNTVKSYKPETFYHVYNRGVAKMSIFKDQEDYAVFMNLLKRYLSPTPVKDDKNREYVSLRDELELLSFCLMPNHFHMLVYIKDDHSLPRLMKSVSGAYTKYFNRKYSRIGHLFQDVYKAKWVSNDEYLLHISRYIHRNPADYKQWLASSYSVFAGEQRLDWLQPEKITELFSSKKEYTDFVASYTPADKEQSLTLLANY